MSFCLAYEPQNLNNFDSLLFPLDKIKNVINKVSITIGKIAVDVFGFEINDCLDAFQNENDSLDVNQLTPISCIVTEKIEDTTSSFDIVVPQSEINVLNIRKKMLEDSFMASFDAEKKGLDVFLPTFEQLECYVQRLDFKGCFVDVSTTEELIDFNLTFDGDLFVSIAKAIGATDSNEVMFSISRKKRKIIISQMDVDELISKIKDVQKIIQQETQI